MSMTRVFWSGTKDDSMNGEFIDRSTRSVIATGAYGDDGYEVLMETGELRVFPNAGRALTELNKTVT